MNVLYSHFDRFFGFLNDTILVVDGLEIVYVNDSGVELLDAQSREDVLGRDFRDFIGQEYKEVFDGGFKEIVEDLGFLPFTMNGTEVNLRAIPAADSGNGMFILEVRNLSEAKRSSEDALSREMLLREVVHSMSEVFITTDQEGAILTANDAACAFFGETQANLCKQNIKSFLEESPKNDQESSDSASPYDNLMGIIGAVDPDQAMVRTKDGKNIPVHVSCHRVNAPKYGDIHAYLIKDSSRSTQLQEEKFRLATSVFDTTSEGMIVTDSDGVILIVNPAFTKITGYSVEEAIGRKPSMLKSEHHTSEFYKSLWDSLLERGEWRGEIWNRRKNGEIYPQWLSIVAMHEDGAPSYFVALFHDLTKTKQDEQKIYYQANYDFLTDLPNRSLFTDRINQALKNARREGTNVVIMFSDLDGFKLVNDSLGHPAGDQLLKQVGQRLKSCVRDPDTVARLGGDEFAVLIDTPSSVTDAEVVAQRVIDAVNQPFDLGNAEASVSTSIGITVFPDDGETVDQLLANADVAMYDAKENGKATYRFFTPAMNVDSFDRLQIRNHLSRAKENEEFFMVYQPKVKASDGSIVGAEALLRWNNESLGMVSPGQFIPILERSGMIRDVGAWIIESVCGQGASLVEAGHADISLAVNLSVNQLHQPGILEFFQTQFDRYDLEPKTLQIEITESLLMKEPEKVSDLLKEFQNMGVRIAIDDFGTGFSSLGYLRQFPIDIIKIDRSFIQNIATDTESAEIVRAIISMGHALKREIVAEGVEEDDQMEILRDYRCDVIQGFLTGRPMESDKFLDTCAQKHPEDTNADASAGNDSRPDTLSHA